MKINLNNRISLKEKMQINRAYENKKQSKISFENKNRKEKE